MALGKNLKKKKLISNELEDSISKKGKKEVVPKKKELIVKTKSAQKKRTVTKKKQVKKQIDKEPKQVLDTPITAYISNQLREKKKLLRERYTQQIEGVQTKIVQMIAFQIGGEEYAIDIDQVKEIVPIPQLHKTPNTPRHIKGIANVRGLNYIVFDLAARFHSESDPEIKFLLILNSSDIKAGLTLPSLPFTIKIEGKKISSEMNLIEDASLDVSYIKGIIQHQEKLIYYLDIMEMLKSDKAVVIPDEIINKG